MKPKIKVSLPATFRAAPPVLPTAPATGPRAHPRITVIMAAAGAPEAPNEVSAPIPLSGDVAWHGVLAIEGQMTGDGRLIEPNALTWDTLPLVLRWCPIDNGSHGGAIAVGLISSVERDATGNINASGTIDTNTPEGADAAARMASGLLSGVSVDLDDMQIQVMVPQGVIDGAQAALPEPDENGMVVVHEGSANQEQLHITSARLRAATLVDIPAFEGARLALDNDGAPLNKEPVLAPGPDSLVATGHVSLTAAALPIPNEPPAAWFANPHLPGPTPITILDDGRIFGHIALWGTCHTGFAGQCVTPPHSATNYALFNVGSLRTREGTEVAVGHITMDTGHAKPMLAAAPALAHYDNTGTAVADVTAGQDGHGIYLTGALRSGVTPERLRALRSSPMSGDWRAVRGRNLELVAVLAVNLPGFPVPRAPQALVASGAVTSLQLPVDVNASGHAKLPDPPAVEGGDSIIRIARAGGRLPFALPKTPGSVSPSEERLKAYWTEGEGAAKIRWGEPCDFCRCLRQVQAAIVKGGKKPMPGHELKGFCANLHHRATGTHPGGEGGHHDGAPHCPDCEA